MMGFIELVQGAGEHEMAISDANRKLLWGRAHDRCAICKRPLTADAESPEMAGLVFGQEAHIVAQAPGGPRGQHNDRTDIDSYTNLILLCPEDHKRVDDQPDVYSVEKLRDLKAAHEKWAADRIDGTVGFEPIKVRRGANEDSIPFQPLTSGFQVWHLISGAHQWNLFPLSGSQGEDREDAADQFLETVKDWGELASELDSLTQIREAQRSISGLLEDLWAVNLYAWGRRLVRTISGGVLPDGKYVVAELIVLAAEDVPKYGAHEASDHRPEGDNR